MNPLGAFTFWLFVVGPLVCLGLCMYANRLDRREGLAPQTPTSFYLPGAVMSLMLLAGWVSRLHADTVISDGCELLERWSLAWILASCYWNN
jgi:hypothetical protein